MDTPNNAQTGAKPPRRWWKAVMVVSLGLNLLVFGLVGGAILRGGPPGHPELVRDLGFGPFTEALAPEDRLALRRAFAAQTPDFRDMRATMRDEMQTIVTLMRAEPFDAAALRAAMAAGVARMGERVALGQRLLADHLATMPPEARRAFADRLERSVLRGRDRGQKDGGPKDGLEDGHDGEGRDKHHDGN